MTDTAFVANQKVNVTLALYDGPDGTGNSLGAPSGPVSWSSPDDPGVVTLAIAADTLSADVVGASAGTATVTITDGATGLSTTVVATVSAAGQVAVSLGAIVSAPEAQ